MKFFGKLTAATLAVSGLALIGSAANAQVFLPANTPATGIGTITAPGGSVVTTGVPNPAFLSSPFSFTNGSNVTIAGLIRSTVFVNGTAGANSTGGTSYDFYYQIVVNAGSDALQSVSLASFLGFVTGAANVTTDIDGAGNFVASSAVAGTAQRNFTGSGLLFDFGAGVLPGNTTATLIVRTNATGFSTGTAGLLGTNGVATNASVLTPLAVTTSPEPGSVALLGVGLAGMTGMVLRRRKSA